MTGLRDRSAFVTGAGSGIGRAIARRLAADDARVAVADINLAGARETEAMIRAAGGTACAVAVDVANLAAVQAAVQTASDAHGTVDVLVNNAGWDRIEPFVENTPEFWDRVIGINFRGPIHCCRAVIDGMIAAGRGTIVSISSDAARVGSSGAAVYSACKGGVISLSKTLARELARHRISVNVVCPGPTDTPLLDEVRSSERGAKIIAAMTRAVPLGRLGTPDDVAEAVAFFASPAAAFITGQVLSVSGGLTMAG
jgi:2-hydroxycyclohexanecarboxyl-CoA dehydrogenase